MQILVFGERQDSNDFWTRAFNQLRQSCRFVASLAELKAATERKHYGLIVAEFSNAPSDELLGEFQSVNQHSAWALAISHSSCADEFARLLGSGFDERSDRPTSAQLLSARIRRASHLIKLENHIVQSQKLESIGELAAGIAHEINTPIQYVGDNTRFVKEACEDINEILTCCQALIASVESTTGLNAETESLRQAMDDADVEYLVDEIPSAINQTLEGVDRVANIVRAMKEFSHPGESEMVASDLAHEIENTVMVARNEWKYVADLNLDFDKQLPAIPCLIGELNQVVLNLIVNAAHAIGDSLGTTPTSKGVITIQTRKADAFAEIRVSDTGRGIPEELISKIFQPFFTTKSAGKGTGQGLAIAHTVVVEKHHGTISVESVVGEGTTFIIRIPLEQQRDVQHDSQNTLCG